MKNKIVIFDIETGGLQARPTIMSLSQWEALEKFGRGPKPHWPWRVPVKDAPHRWRYCPGNPITQVAAIACDADTLEPIEEFEVKLMFRPELAVPEALEANSYDEKIWKTDAQTYPNGLSAFCAFLDRHKTVEMVSERTGNPYRVAQLAGHNASSFDLEFILRSCEDPIWQRYALPGDAPRTEPPRGLFFPGSFQVLDTLHLARWAYAGLRDSAPKNFKLETLAEFYDIDSGESHDALADVRTTRKIASILREAVNL